MRGLLDAAQRLQRLLDDRDVEFRVVVFIRTDIYEHLTDRTPDRGKETVISLDWDDAQLFREIVRQRIVTSTGLEGTFEQVWANVGPPLIGIEDTFGYLLDRTFLRPRDLLLFLDAAVQVAVEPRARPHTGGSDSARRGSLQRGYASVACIRDRRHTSHSICGDLLLSGRSSNAEAADPRGLLERAGLNSAGEQAAGFELLVWYGFLGVKAPDSDEELYSYKVRYNMPRLKHAVATEQGRYVIHPGFRAALGIT